MPGFPRKYTFLRLNLSSRETSIANPLVDLASKHHPGGGPYSWWDYRRLAFPRNDGLRIDHIYTNEELAARSLGLEVDRDERKGAKPSDHAPVLATFAPPP